MHFTKFWIQKETTAGNNSQHSVSNPGHLRHPGHLVPPTIHLLPDLCLTQSQSPKALLVAQEFLVPQSTVLVH